MTPLRQKPHCAARSSMNACWTGCGCSIVPRPSSLLIAARAACDTGVTHDRTARPPTITVHAPHCPRPQPNFGPFSARSSLSTYNSGVAGSTSTVCGRPLTFSVMAIRPTDRHAVLRARQAAGGRAARFSRTWRPASAGPLSLGTSFVLLVVVPVLCRRLAILLRPRRRHGAEQVPHEEVEALVLAVGTAGPVPRARDVEK